MSDGHHAVQVGMFPSQYRMFKASVFISTAYSEDIERVHSLESRNQTAYSSRESLLGCTFQAVNSRISLLEICSCFSFSVSCRTQAEIFL